MKKVILHIGIPKTGSSALQSYFYKHKELYESIGIGYFIPKHRYTPWSTYSNGHFVLANALIKLDKQIDKRKEKYLIAYPSLDVFRLRLNNVNKDFLSEDRKSFIEYAKKYETLLISEEMFWHYELYYDGYWKNIKEYITECAGDCEITVIVYLRRQDKWMQSKWKEDMRNEIPLPLDFYECLKLYKEIGYLDYYNSLLKIEETFGKDYLVVKNFERSAFEGNSIVNDFLSIFSFPSFFDNEFDSKNTVNESISIETANALSLINKNKVNITKRDERFHLAAAIFNRYLSGKENNTFIISKNERINLVKDYQEENEAIGQRYNCGQLLFDNTFDDGITIKSNYKKDRKNAYLISVFAKYTNVINKMMLLKEMLIGKTK